MNDDDGGRRPDRRPVRSPSIDRDAFASSDREPAPGKSTHAERLPPAHPAAVATRAVRAAHGAAARVESWAPQLMDRVAAADYLESGRLSFEIRSSLKRAETGLDELERSDPHHAAMIADQIAAARERLATLRRELAMLLRAAPVIEAADAGSAASEQAWKAGRGANGSDVEPSMAAATRSVTPADLERAVIAAGKRGASEDRWTAAVRASEVAGLTSPQPRFAESGSFPAADVLAGPYVVALDVARRARAWHDDVAALAPRLGIAVADVTIVADDTARSITDGQNARGVALGDAIYLHPERVAPGTAAGREVLAHELVHLAQSRLAVDPDAAVDDRDAAEHEAASLAPSLARGDAVATPTRRIDLRRPAADSDAPLPFGLQALFDGQLLAALESPVAAADERGALARVESIEALVRGFPPLVCGALVTRIERRAPGDAVAAAFRRQLSRGSRARVLQVIRERSRIPESSPARAPATGTTGITTAGSDAMWHQTIGEKSTEVGKLARVARVKGVGLFERPAASATPTSILPFNALVQVQRRTMHGWCWVVATTGSGGVGFVREQHLAIDPPEPTAELHPVSPGERLGAIADRYYGSSFRDGNDARLYVQALYLANQNRRGVYLDDVDLGLGSTWHRGADEERTLEIYRGAKVRSGHTIWVPSEAFVQALKASGAITSGTSTISQVWNKAKQLVGDVIDGIAYVAGFVIGFLDGAWTAITDLFDDAAELISIIAKTIWHLITGNPGQIKSMLMNWVRQLDAAWSNRADIASDLLAKWNDDSAWDRGQFQGKALGWVAMTAILAAVTGGVVLVAKAGRFATIASALDRVGALGDVTTYVGSGIRLPGHAADAIRKRLGGDASATNIGGGKGRDTPAPAPATDSSSVPERLDSDLRPAPQSKRTTEGAHESTADRPRQPIDRAIAEFGELTAKDFPDGLRDPRLNTIQEAARLSNDEMAQAVKSVLTAAGVEGVEMQHRAKSLKSILGKLRESDGTRVSDIKDLSGVRINIKVIRNAGFQQHSEIVDLLVKELGISRSSIKDYNANPNAWGYTGRVHLFYMDARGVYTEIQVGSEELSDFIETKFKLPTGKLVELHDLTGYKGQLYGKAVPTYLQEEYASLIAEIGRNNGTGRNIAESPALVARIAAFERAVQEFLDE